MQLHLRELQKPWIYLRQSWILLQGRRWEDGERIMTLIFQIKLGISTRSFNRFFLGGVSQTTVWGLQCALLSPFWLWNWLIDWFSSPPPSFYLTQISHALSNYFLKMLTRVQAGWEGEHICSLAVTNLCQLQNYKSIRVGILHRYILSVFAKPCFLTYNVKWWMPTTWD